MLLSIDIRNFAIIKSLQLDWHAGMTVITGETGAGKSIVIDALGLTLGERADHHSITAGAKQSEVSATFAVFYGSAAHHWLDETDLSETDFNSSDLNGSGSDQDSQNLTNQTAQISNECILRRIIVREGRSKCYINGRSVTQSQLKQLGSLLVDIHGQHTHQSLLKSKEQLNLLDRYANHADLIDNVKLAFQQLKAIENRQLKLQQQQRARDSKRELLTYQVEELMLANPQQSILDNLENEHKQAATSQDRLSLAQDALVSLSDEESTSSISLLQAALSQLNKLSCIDPSIKNLVETLSDAESLLQDANAELSDYSQQLNSDPETLERLNQQLSQFHDLARKHHVSLSDLATHFTQLQQDLDSLTADDNELMQIEIEYAQSVKRYLQQANLLSKSRAQTASQLEKLVAEKIQPLAMEGGQFSIQINQKSQNYGANGMEDIDFLVSANPGQPLQALNKVASGGELSRISLAISVITSEQQLVPCIIFDEVDVGIGGATAETVGILLKILAKDTQVLCVTHQPQVASCGDQHLVASKTKTNDSTITKVSLLNQQQRIEEVARMLGGKVISEKTISHATEMLKL